MSQPAIFFDKDGTLVDNVPYNVDVARLSFARDAGAAIARLAATSGYQFFVVSNQPGIGLGLFEAQALHGIANALADFFVAHGARLADFYYCPHAPELSCDCRKPLPGMLRRAATEHQIDLARSWMIGDILDDIEAGNRAGCKTILLDVGNETEWLAGAAREPDLRTASLLAAAEHILQSAQHG